MFKVLILTAIFAVALAAPAPQDKESHGLTRPSPINPEVISDPKPEGGQVVTDADDKDDVKPVTPDETRRKRDEHEKETEKPQDKKHQNDSEKLESHNIGHDAVGCLEDKCARKISKRNSPLQAEHEHEHKPQEGGDRSKDIKTLEHHLAPHELQPSKKNKRDHHEPSDQPEKPHSVVAHEGLAHNPATDHSKDIKTLEHHLGPHELDSSKKHKRDIHEQHEHADKPHSVEAQESLVHKPTSTDQQNSDITDAIKTLEERLGEHKGEAPKKQKRDIPVPTVAKYDHPDVSSKSEDKKPLEEKDKPQVEDISAAHKPHEHNEHKSPLTEHPVIRHKPVPVAELFARPKPNEEEEVAAAPPQVPTSASAEKA